MSEVLLNVSRLWLRRGRAEVIRGVSFTIAEGEVVALLGPNGAGKSTLIDAIGGGLAPASGSVTRNGRIAVALQSPDLARRSVAANVSAALAWWGVPRAERPRRTSEALAAIGASELASRPAQALSGGERRRVHLARVLALTPDLLVLDEPFAGLDAEIRGALLADTGRALRRHARGALVVVHDRAEAWALADRLLILLDGVIAAEGPPRDLLDHPPSARVARFLGFDGELVEPDGSHRLTRPQHVRLAADGPLLGVVSSLVPTEDGARVELTLPEGRLVARTELPGPRLGESVRLAVRGGVRFARGEAQDPPDTDPTVAPADAQVRRP